MYAHIHTCKGMLHLRVLRNYTCGTEDREPLLYHLSRHNKLEILSENRLTSVVYICVLRYAGTERTMYQSIACALGTS